MKKEILEKVLELKNSGLSIGEIADELNISTDTARYLVLNAEKLLEKSEPIDLDIYVDWRNIGSSGERLRYLSLIMADIIKSRNIDFDIVIGISNSGIPLATLIASELKKEFGVYITKKDENKGSLSKNFSPATYKKAIIIDDIVTSGKTLTECIKKLKEVCSPKLIVVLIDKSGLNEIEGIPLVPLIRVSGIKVEK
ncbi:orotate phosphoribosyltransferase-like protein [Methanocaldococcus infernus]|nr:orotate phosphoribosyltransferase-like protein [Methanocaldococcus infernus]